MRASGVAVQDLRQEGLKTIVLTGDRKATAENLRAELQLEDVRAELKPDQKDEDSLPPYPVLDAILKGLIERDLGAEELVAEGQDAATVQRIWRLLENSEYKRRQAPPGVKITSRTISRDRRYPIVNRFRG